MDTNDLGIRGIGLRKMRKNCSDKKSVLKIPYVSYVPFAAKIKSAYTDGVKKHGLVYTNDVYFKKHEWAPIATNASERDGIMESQRKRRDLAHVFFTDTNKMLKYFGTINSI
jgi:hypothetical protein